MKIFSRSRYSADWLKPLVDVEIVDRIKDAELLVLPGGADIDPMQYGDNVGSYTSFSKVGDHMDFTAAHEAVKKGIPIIGICRGAQLVCVLSKGKLIQHVNHHHGSHMIMTDNNKVYHVNSIHHQMMFPFNLKENEDYKIIARSEKLSDIYLDGNDRDLSVGFKRNFVEPEIVWFPKTRSLAIQSHPEFGSMPDKTLQYMLDLVKKYILAT